MYTRARARTRTHSFPRFALAKRKSTQIFELRSTCISFGHPATFVDFRQLWSSSNSYASRRKFFTVWPPNATRHKLIASHLWNFQLSVTLRELMSRLTWTYEPTCVNLWADLRIRLATHRKSVRKFWFCKLASNSESVRAETWRVCLGLFRI